MILHQPLFLTAPVTLGLTFALVVDLLALGDANLQLHQTPMIEVEHQRHEAQSLGGFGMAAYRADAADPPLDPPGVTSTL